LVDLVIIVFLLTLLKLFSTLCGSCISEQQTL